MDLKQRGLEEAPKLAVGDGALEFWKAVAKCWPDTDQQRCWVHKTANSIGETAESPATQGQGGTAQYLAGRNTGKGL